MTDAEANAVFWYFIIIWGLFSACILLPILFEGISRGVFNFRRKK